MIKKYLLDHFSLASSVVLVLLANTLIGQSSELIIDLSSLDGRKNTASSISFALHKQLGRIESLKIINEDGGKGDFSLERIDIQSFHPRVRRLSNPRKEEIYYSSIQELYAVKDNMEQEVGVFIRYPQSVVGEFEMEGEDYSIEYSQCKVILEKRSSKNKRRMPSMSICSVKGDAQEALAIENTGYQKNNETKVLDIGIIMDNKCVADAGGVENAIDRVIVALALSHSDYESIYENILFNVAEIVVSDCPSCDPWLSSTDVSVLHNDVHEWSKNINIFGENDLNIFWTGREFDNDVLGSAHVGSICSNQNLALVKDLTAIPWKMRVVLSHEIGHILGASHVESAGHIMSQIINNTSTWSPKSVQNILNNLAASNCINDEEHIQCDWSGDIEISWSSVDVLSINCAMENLDSISLVVRNQENASIESIRNITSESTLISNILKSCEDYIFEFTPHCELNDGRIVELIWGAKIDSQIEVSDVYILECTTDGNGMPTYDLGLHIMNHGEVKNYTLNYKDENRSFIVYSGSNNYIFPNYSNEALSSQVLSLLYNSNEEWLCSFNYNLDEPSLDCAFRISEDFNTCGITPLGWRVTQSDNAHDLFRWSSEGPDRAIINYGNASNSLTSKTIDGTCMMVIDDDLVNLPNHSGSTILESPYFEVVNISHLQVAFDLIFDRFTLKGSNTSFLSFQANQGIGWTELKKVESGLCHWSNIWAAGCSSEMLIDLTQFEGDSIRFRWIYDDGGTGQWTGMAALDNFELTGSKIPIDPCEFGDVYIVEAPQESIVEYGSMIYINTTIDIPEAQLNITEGAIFYPGTSISQGARLFVDVEQCEEE